MGFLSLVGFIIGGIVIAKIALDKICIVLRTRELSELKDCPFKFVVKSEHVIFTLNKDTKLWCEYSLGIRSDGIYGVSELEMQGINGSNGYISNLKIGQSVFPIISAMDEFLLWSKVQPFTTKFKDGFESEWKSMKKKIDNLRYLESEDKKKSK